LTAKEPFSPEFLYYVLSDNNFFNYDTVTSKGTKMPRGTPSAIMKYLVPDYGPEKQSGIVSILSAYDNLIETNNKRIKVLEQMAENLYKEWFVHFRFPRYETAELENGIPKGFTLCHLSDFLSFGSGKPKPSEGSLFPVYGGNGIADWCNKHNSENIIIIGRVGAYSGSVYYEPEKCWISDNALYAKRITDDIDSIYYDFYLLRSLKLNKFQGGTGQPLVTQGMLSKIKVYLPTVELIEKYCKFVKPIFTEINKLNQQKVNLAKQRDLLLPRLMSGKLEV